MTETTSTGSDELPRVPAQRRPGHIRTYGDGRTCAEPLCGTTLSRYNKETFCWRHSQKFEKNRRLDG